MNLFAIALKSFRYFGKTNLAIALGVAAATAVLTGALIVGESMRTSLRELTLDRLGKIDEMLVSDGFFRAKLAREIEETDAFKKDYRFADAAILFPGGTVETESLDGREPNLADAPAVLRTSQVTVLGVSREFCWFPSYAPDIGDPTKHSNLLLPQDQQVAIINQALADDLNISSDDVLNERAKITVRVPKQTQLPADSALGRKTDLIESLVDLRVINILPNQGLGRFSLFPSQADPYNVFVPIKLLQDSLSRSVLKHKSDPNQANVIFLAGKDGVIPSPTAGEALRSQLEPTLEDYGLNLKQVTQVQGNPDGPNPVPVKTMFEYWSLSSDQLVLSDEAVRSIDRGFPQARPVFTYLANDIRKQEAESGVPFSMVAGINFDDQYRLESAFGGELTKLADNEIVLNEWAAADIGANVGDSIVVTYFEPETTHGSQVESSETLVLAGIAKLAEPDAPFSYSRRKGLEPAIFIENAPTLANDPDLTPEVPGVTDAESIEDWDLPFSTVGKLRTQDDVYWDDFRTTPKAFVNLTTARRLWKSRFGSTTNFRIPIDSGDQASLENQLLRQFIEDDAKLGMHLIRIKQRGLDASSGSTPFDVLFLALSMFVIGSALILVSLLFRLGLQQRVADVGLMKAVGFSNGRLRNVWLIEMLLVSLLGAILGIALGVGYAWLMIQGLSTWWVGAIAKPFLTMHVGMVSLLVGLISGLLICIITIAVSLRRAGREPVTGLLRGNLESESPASMTTSKWRSWVAALMFISGIGLAVAATQLSGEAQAGSFMGAGFLVLMAGLLMVYQWLKRPADANEANHLSLSRLALLSAKRNPLRSTLTIGLVAVASFLIAAVSAFRLKPSDEGTAGFDWVAQSSQPVFEDLGTVEGQDKLLGEENRLAEGTEVLSLRYKAGEDASCNNLYQSTQPRALGVPTRFVDHFADPATTQFAWAGNTAETDAQRANPWQLLSSETAHAGTEEDPIPVVIDKNTANYSLKIYLLGTVKQISYDSGETIFVEVVGFLENTILQGSLIMSENDFVRAFPRVAGYQYFLIQTDDQPAVADSASEGDAVAMDESVATLEYYLGDQGFDARSAERMLSNFMSVQNTYLSTFQTLGALGLLLGTFGLAAVQIRSVLERQQELGLMRAVGFELSKLSRLVMLENVWLMVAGLSVGIGAALFTTIPHWLVGSATVPWASLGVIFAVIAAVGFFAGWLASRRIARVPLLESLRA
ncbi:MAG: ABC transporter permease [Planctomycetota bacterium]